MLLCLRFLLTSLLMYNLLYSSLETLMSSTADTLSILGRIGLLLRYGIPVCWTMQQLMTLTRSLSELALVKKGNWLRIITNCKEKRNGSWSKNYIWNFPIDAKFKSTNPFGWPRIAISVSKFDVIWCDMLWYVVLCSVLWSTVLCCDVMCWTALWCDVQQQLCLIFNEILPSAGIWDWFFGAWRGERVRLCPGASVAGPPRAGPACVRAPVLLGAERLGVVALGKSSRGMTMTGRLGGAGLDCFVMLCVHCMLMGEEDEEEEVGFGGGILLLTSLLDFLAHSAVTFCLSASLCDAVPTVFPALTCCYCHAPFLSFWITCTIISSVVICIVFRFKIRLSERRQRSDPRENHRHCPSEAQYFHQR